MKLLPMSGFILVEPLKESGKLFVPDQNKKTQKGKVLSCGGDKKRNIKVGDIVVYGQWNGVPFNDGKKEYLFLKYEEILAKCIEK